MFQTSCFDLWCKETISGKIVTLVKELDDHLGSGLPLGLITELCGASGTGKTHLQLCINVQFPLTVGGLEGKALFIDTNGGFSPFRLREIAQGMVRCFHPFNAEKLLKNVSYVDCCNHTELMIAVSNLRNTLLEDQKLKLIVIDSFSFPLRFLEDISLRSRIGYEILTDLQSLALKFNVAVVITNELTTRYVDGEWCITPALGETHSHKINQRLMFRKEMDTGCHIVTIDKSLICGKVSVPFKISSTGIRTHNSGRASVNALSFSMYNPTISEYDGTHRSKSGVLYYLLQLS
uniref:DNA repair protein RAD51 homolog 3 n=1 Tax=Glossina austeni TaxID=7395 RepID=A0A1A9UNF6_GLOAU